MKRVVESIVCDLCIPSKAKAATLTVDIKLKGHKRGLDVCADHEKILMTRSTPAGSGSPVKHIERPFPCPYCDKTWPTPQAMTMHVTTGHPDKPNTRQMRDNGAAAERERVEA